MTTMEDEVERLAEAMHKQNPVTIEGQSFDWGDVVRSYPDRAAIYREAAKNRMRAEEAMKRLAHEPVRSKPDPAG